MPLIEIDLTDGVLDYRGDELPDPSLLCDDGNIVLTLGDVSIRMGYCQAERIFGAWDKWRNTVGAENPTEI